MQETWFMSSCIGCKDIWPQHTNRVYSKNDHTSYQIPFSQYICAHLFSSSLMNINCILNKKHISGKVSKTEFDNYDFTLSHVTVNSLPFNMSPLNLFINCWDSYYSLMHLRPQGLLTGWIIILRFLKLEQRPTFSSRVVATKVK